jgi:hypothetical protein
MPDRARLDDPAPNNPYKGYVTAPAPTTEEAGKCKETADGKLQNGSVTADGRGYETFRNERGPSLSAWQVIWNALLLPIKRHYGQPWLQPVARYGYIGAEFDFLEPDPDRDVKTISEYVSPKVPGQLFFYFNDAIVPGLSGSNWFYGNNHGCATFFVKPAK